MAKKSILVEVNPAVLIWLRESSGWEINDVAKRLQTSERIILAIEQGKKQPTLRQLKTLAAAYHRPLAIFLLSEPKEEKPLPKDYRMITGKRDRFDKKTLLAIRKARHLQTVSQELAKNTDRDTSLQVEFTTLRANPQEVASFYRDLFQLTLEKQQNFTSSYKFFYYLRDVLEELNILVFQFSMPIDDARGFTLADELPVAIVVNTKDIIQARLFSLMHEFAHILLGETVIDLPNLSNFSDHKIETWCNEFASAFLLPSSFANNLFDLNLRNLLDTEVLKSLSRKTNLSKGMLLYNMYKMGFITLESYKGVLNRYQKLAETKEKEKKTKEKSGGGIPQDRKCLSELGVKFVSLVADNFESKKITYSDALSYLSIKAKHFDKVLAKAEK